MAVIKARTRGKHMRRLVTRLDHENLETLHAYAAFLGEPVEYVLNEVIDTVLAKDKDFVKWRAEHPASCAPTASTRRRDRAARPSLAAQPASTLGGVVASATSRS